MSDYRGNRVVPRSIKNNGNNNILLDLLLNYDLPINVNGALNIAGLISGTKGISLSSASSGTLNLLNKNTYTGSTVIDSGTLKISGDGSLGGPGATYGGTLYIQNNGILDYSSSVDQILTGLISDGTVSTQSTKIIVNGSGKLHFRNQYGWNYFSGTLQINSGAYVKVGNNDTDVVPGTTTSIGRGTISSISSIIQNGTLEIDRNSASSQANINANISGSGPIIVTRSSNIIFAGISSHNGTFTINSGTVTYNRQCSHEFVNNGTLILNMTDALYWQTIGDGIFSKTIGSATTPYVRNTDWTLGTSSSGFATAQVQDAGFGNDMSEFSGFVAGRIALVQRGVQSFQVKVNNAIAAGAVGVIIYNNTTGLTTPTVTASIPVIMVTQAIGQQMVTEISSGTVTAALNSGVSPGALAAPIFSNSLTGTGILSKSGTGTIVVGSNANHSGSTNVTAGALRITGNNRLPNSSVVVSSGAAFEILGGSTFSRNISTNGGGISSGGTIRNISGDNILSGNITQVAVSRINSDAGTLTLSSAGTLTGTFGLTFGGAGNILVQRIINISTGGVTKDGAGTLTLTADNTYTGTTTLSAGTLVIGNGGTTGAIAGNVSVATGSTLTFNRSNDYTYAGVLSGAGSIIKQGSGSLILTGANSQTGSLTVSAGTLQIGNGGTTGSIGGAVTNNGVVVFNRNNALTHSTVISGTGSVTNSGTGTTTLTGTNTYTGGTTISAGGITIGAGSTTGSIVGNVTNNGTLTFNRSDAYAYAGVISGTGNVAKSAAGATTLSGNNTYSGTTTISGGALRVAHANALGSATTTVSIPASTAIELTGGIAFARNLSSAGTGVSSGGSLRNISGNNTFNGNYTMTAASRINSDADTLTLSSTGTLTGTFGLTFGGSGNVLVQRVIATSTGTVTKDGSGTVVLSASNTYTGVTTLSGGTTRFATTSSLYNGNTASWTRTNIIVNTGAVFAINVGGANEFTTTNVNTLLTNLLTTINNNGLRSGSSIGFDTSNSASDFTISNSITNSAGTGAGAVGVVKLGTGTLVLSGTGNTYTGGTVINGGTLKAGNATCFGTGTITINAGAILDRAGFTITNTIVNNDGTIIN